MDRTLAVEQRGTESHEIGDRDRRPTAIRDFLKVGRPPRMPAFDLPDPEITSLYAFIKGQTDTARESGTSDPNVILVVMREPGRPISRERENARAAIPSPVICAASGASTPRSSSRGAWFWREATEVIRGWHFRAGGICRQTQNRRRDR